MSSHSMPAFSVIVPTYNRAGLLPRCIGSVLAQTWHDWELIVADDGSTDETEALVRQVAERDARVRYVRQEHLGAGDARNLGASHARGQFLTFVDSDDEVAPDWLARFHPEFSTHAAHITCCGSTDVAADGAALRTRLPNVQLTLKNGQGGLFLSGTFALKREVFEAVGGYAPGLPANQHSELRLRLLPLCDDRDWKLTCINESLVRRHRHALPSIRGDARAVYDSGVYILHSHSEILKTDGRIYADWATACGGCAWKLGQLSAARHWFWQAIRANPRNAQNYLRFLATWASGLATKK